MKRASRRRADLTAVRIRNRRLLPALLTLAAVTMAAACSSSEEDPSAGGSPSPTTASPTDTLSAAEAQARKDVIAAYQGMTTEQVKAYAKASLKGSNITKYATGKALRDVKDAVFVNMQNGIVVQGEPKVTASEEDVDLSLDGSPQRATLRLCFDMNTWEPIYKESGKSAAPPDQVKRYTITANLQKQANQWRVTDEKADKEQKC